MEIFDGLPTLIGGFNSDSQTQNRDLFQYDLESNQWRRHPTARLRIGRSSLGVFQVPRTLIDDC